MAVPVVLALMAAVVVALELKELAAAVSTSLLEL